MYYISNTGIGGRGQKKKEKKSDKKYKMLRKSF